MTSTGRERGRTRVWGAATMAYTQGYAQSLWICMAVLMAAPAMSASGPRAVLERAALAGGSARGGCAVAITSSVASMDCIGDPDFDRQVVMAIRRLGADAVRGAFGDVAFPGYEPTLLGATGRTLELQLVQAGADPVAGSASQSGGLTVAGRFVSALAAPSPRASAPLYQRRAVEDVVEDRPAKPSPVPSARVEQAGGRPSRNAEVERTASGWVAAPLAAKDEAAARQAGLPVMYVRGRALVGPARAESNLPARMARAGFHADELIDVDPPDGTSVESPRPATASPGSPRAKRGEAAGFGRAMARHEG